MTNIYSDRIAETYASGTGGVVQFYLYATSTVTDGELTFETSNQNIAFELDEVSFRSKNIVTKNTNVNEVLVFSNTGNTVVNQACPSGIPCAQYVDTSNANIGWPGSNLTVPAFSSVLALWNNSSNLLTVPVVSMSLDS